MTPVEVILIVTGVVAAVGAVVGAVATILDLRATKRSVDLAENQAKTRPALEVTMELRDMRAVEDVWDLVRNVLQERKKKADEERKEREEQARKAREQRERERTEKEEQEARERRIREGKASGLDKAIDKMPGKALDAMLGKSTGSYPLSIDTSKLFLPMPNTPYYYNYESEPYRGPLPDKVVVVRVGNRGRIAAYDVTGWLYFDIDYLMPLQEFSDGYVEENSEEGIFKVEVGFSEGTKILPTPNDDREFSIAVVARPPGTTKVRYEFQTPQGDTAEGEQELELPGG